MFQDNFPDTYSTQENNSLSNQLSSQDARVLLTIYPDFLAIPVSAPLKLGRGFVGKKIAITLFDNGANIMAIDRKQVPKSAYTGKYVCCRKFSDRTEVFFSE